MYYYFYNDSTGEIASEIESNIPLVVGEGEWEGYSYVDSETKYSLDYKINLTDRTFELNQPLVDENLARSVRAERDGLLSGTDYTQLADYPSDGTSFTAYRQALRDIPEQAGFPHDVVFPTRPINA